MPFSLAALKSLIENNEKRFKPLHDKIELRHAHFHNETIADPKLDPPFDQGPKFQTDELRRIHSALKSRLTENHFVVTCKPQRESSTQRTAATRMEQFFNDGLRLIEEREHMILQGAAADGQIISCYAVLHWSMAKDIWPEVPEPEYLEPGDYTGPDAENYTALYKGEDQGDEAESDSPYYIEESDAAPKGYRQYPGGDPMIRPVSRYKEKQTSVDARYRKSCAEAGFPWNVEFINPTGFCFVNDRSVRDGGYGIAIVRRTVGLLDYLNDINEEKSAEAQDSGVISLNQADSNIPVYGEVEAPVHAMLPWTGANGITYPSENDWGETATIYQVWTRDEFYEVLATKSDWKLVKSGTHPYKKPPFSLIPATTVTSPDPVRKYEPALEGVFRLKPFYDYQMTLMQTVAEQVALPFYYWKHTGTGQPKLNEKGEKITFQRDSAEAEEAPEGYSLERLPFEINAGFMTAVQWTAEALKQAAPPTGRAEISASTQPWAIRLQQAQESVEPAALLNNISRGILEMVRNMAYVHSLPPGQGGFDEPVYVFGVTADGKIDKEKTQTIENTDVVSLDFGVVIAPESSAERITKEEHGRQLLADPFVPLTDVHWARDYAGWEKPEERVLDYQAYSDYQTFVRPALAQSVIREKFGNMASLGSDGQWSGFGGQQLSPQQVLQMKGQKAMNGETPRQKGTAGINGAAPTTMNNLEPIQAPGTLAMQGLQG